MQTATAPSRSTNSMFVHRSTVTSAASPGLSEPISSALPMIMVACDVRRWATSRSGRPGLTNRDVTVGRSGRSLVRCRPLMSVPIASGPKPRPAGAAYRHWRIHAPAARRLGLQPGRDRVPLRRADPTLRRHSRPECRAKPDAAGQLARFSHNCPAAKSGPPTIPINGKRPRGRSSMRLVGPEGSRTPRVFPAKEARSKASWNETARLLTPNHCRAMPGRTGRPCGTASVGNRQVAPV